MISFVVPAHNEERFLGPTLQAIRRAASASAEPYEVLVVNDASTDATARIAVESRQCEELKPTATPRSFVE